MAGRGVPPAPYHISLDSGAFFSCFSELTPYDSQSGDPSGAGKATSNTECYFVQMFFRLRSFVYAS